MVNVFGKECTLKSLPFDKTPVPLDQQNIMDGIEFMRKFPNESISCVFLDPRRRDARDYLSYKNKVDGQNKRIKFPRIDKRILTSYIQEIDRILVPSGHLFLWVDKFHILNHPDEWLKNTELKIVDLVVWNKRRMGMGYKTRRVTEYLLIIQKKPWRSKGVWAKHDIPDNWTEEKPNDHPHAKPIGLQKALIEACTRPNDIVLDPCAGSYTVMQAALQAGRHFAGCDLLPIQSFQDKIQDEDSNKHYRKIVYSKVKNF